MKTLEESVVEAMDGSETELFAYLPYILQDIWEIGASPEIILQLVRKHAPHPSGLSILDLGCGKGAVSIQLAKALNCRCLGIDAMEAFIGEAKEKARAWGVEHLCQFETGDIRVSVKDLPPFDIIILGAIGPVLGDYKATLTSLSRCLTPNGLIIIDDSYIEDESKFTHPITLNKGQILQQIEAAGMKLIDEIIIDEQALAASNSHIFELLKARCEELIEQHPAQADLFLQYIRDQEEENEVLETQVVCSTMLIVKMGV